MRINFDNKKLAFTLAEVLITLGIIGVVAAITLPTMITKSKKRVIETQLKEYYSMMNQAFKLAENDYGDMGGWDYPKQLNQVGGTGDYEWFQTYLQPYLKSSTVKTSFHLWCVWYDGFAIEFINGTAASCGMIEGWASNDFLCMFYPKAEKMREVQDNSTQSQKLVPGKDYFIFKINLDDNKGFQPYDSDDCYATTGTKSLPSRGCTKLIQKNNWTIPSNYPIKF